MERHGREIELISRLAEIFAPAKASERDTNLLVDIGDDAAFFRPVGNGVVAATDLLTEGVHFNREWSDLYSIGRKAAAANLADVFAMGVPARYLLVAVAFNPLDGDGILELAQGIADEAALVGARVIGGDISRAQSLTVAITAIGDGDQVITRSDAKVGDGVFIRTLPGRSLLGLEQLRRSEIIDQASVDFHRSPQVAYQDFLELVGLATSLCDLSDGISSDAESLARASKVTIDLESAAILAHPQYKAIAEVAGRLDLDPLITVLSSGEEHSPLFTASTSSVLAEQNGHSRTEGWVRIGTVKEHGKTLLTLDGNALEPGGFSHF